MSTACATMRYLQRNMHISSTQIKTRAYNTYVRPQLQYAATIWDPHTKQNINKLEQVQRTDARWMLGCYRNTSSVSDMLNELGWRSLEQRRADARHTMLYKLRNNMLAVDPSPFLKPAQGSIARVYRHCYITLDTNTKIYAKSYAPSGSGTPCAPPLSPPHWYPHLTHSSVRCVSCNTHTETMARAPRQLLAGAWVGGGSTGFCALGIWGCVISFVVLPVLLPPILTFNSNLLPPFMLFYPCSSFYHAYLCIMVIAMTAHSIGR